MSGWESVQLDELEAIPLFDGLIWRPIRARFDIRAFGINAYESDESGRLIVEEHDETSGGAGGHEELYVVVRGRARFTIDGETADAPAGTLVFIRDPKLRRSALAEEPGTLILATGGEPSRGFEVSAWEAYFGALPDFRAGRFDEAAARIAAALRRRPGHPSLLYNLACAEAQAGRPEDAIEHLTGALAGDPALARPARSDPDLDTLRDHPAFPRLD
jgi:tetratricopeptide (TPR) repeat protein